ncbi:MAG: NAD(+) diphosphatase [Lachnospiraceae bacterium]|nr:NAD(+) diphosphatase [Lachnospiraceae bacterium]
MIQEIQPHIYHVEYQEKLPGKADRILIYEKQKVLVNIKNGVIFPRAKDVIKDWKETKKKCQYLFQIDEEDYFLLENEDYRIPEDYEFIEPRKLESYDTMEKVFAGALGGQLNRWYNVNQYCGRCGAKLTKNKEERAMECPDCGQLIYPVLSPSVIVAVTDKDRLLMTKYAGRDYKKYALVAGYVEAGESLEETVRREVMEEVGLKVKNIRYYKSQPWPFSSTLLAGFFCELDGSDQITLQESELSEAVWFSRDEIPVNPSKLSLTNDMVEAFRDGRE